MPTTDRRHRALGGAAVALLLVGACGDGGDGGAAGSATPLPQGSQAVDLDPAGFTADITHPYWPMAVGTRWVYAESDVEGRAQRVEVTVLDETRTVAAGVEARVVHDLVTDAATGAVVEDTLDWYAQDAAGNLWYLGEQTAEYEDGQVVTTAGSWEAGRDGAQAGVLLPAAPRVGQAYRQEHLAGEAEDEAVVVSLDERVQTAAGSWTGVLMTRDTTPLEPDGAELKLYAEGVGPVLVLQTSGGTSREELVETTR